MVKDGSILEIGCSTEMMYWIASLICLWRSGHGNNVRVNVWIVYSKKQKKVTTTKKRKRNNRTGEKKEQQNRREKGTTEQERKRNNRTGEKKTQQFILIFLINCDNTIVLAEQLLHHNIVLEKLDHSWVNRICTKIVISESHTMSLFYI